jgi:hypothetical protein
MGRDKRHHFLRTQPIHFTSVKSALRKQQSPFIVSFDEYPACLSRSPSVLNHAHIKMKRWLTGLPREAQEL